MGETNEQVEKLAELIKTTRMTPNFWYEVATKILDTGYVQVLPDAERKEQIARIIANNQYFMPIVEKIHPTIEETLKEAGKLADSILRLPVPTDLPQNPYPQTPREEDGMFTKHEIWEEGYKTCQRNLDRESIQKEKKK